MTKEIWAAVIIAIIQITTSVLIGWWQIKNTKANTNPEQNQLEHKKSLPDNILQYSSKIPVHIIIPLILSIIIYLLLSNKYGFTVFTLLYLIISLVLVAMQTMLWLMSNAIKLLLEAIIRIDKRLKCHESILFDLTDKPCKEDGMCKF
jgi:hypothetical protein